MSGPEWLRWQTFPDPKEKVVDDRYLVDVRPGRCFGNACRLTRMFRELTYVEGYAYSYSDIDEVEVKHAWCITPDGEVVDVTWDNGGFAYEGIVFPRALINRIAGIHGLHKWWYRCLQRAGIVAEGVTHGRKMHMARHTAGQSVLDRTGNLKAVQKLLGHSSITTTGDIYTDWDIDQLEETMRIVAGEDDDDGNL